MLRSEYPLQPRPRLFGEELFPIPRLFQRALDQMVEDLWERPALTPARATTFSPRIDVYEDEKQIRVVAELPGIKESDVEIMYEPGWLTLRGEKKEEERRELARGRGRFEECRYGAFERSISLSAGVEESQIQASYDRGVLTISLPKSAEVRAQARKIPVKLGAPAQLEQGARGSRSEAAAH
jgi:HSP20 family protein